MIKLAFLFGFVLATVHFLGEEIEERASFYRENVVSFSTGVSVSYIFLHLLPELQKMNSNNEIMFLFPFLGFSGIHLVEKYVQKTEDSFESIKKDFMEIHSIFLFIYYGSIGFLISALLKENPLSALLFFIPILLHAIVSSLSLTEIHEEAISSLSVKVGIASAPLIGVGIYFLNLVPQYVFQPIFGLVVGMFVYVVIRDSIPKGQKGQIKEYILGALAYLLVILLTSTY